MQRINNRPVYSATDLVGFLACEHLTNLELAASAGLVKRPHYADPELDLLAKRGLEHERRFLEQLRARGWQITDLSTGDADPASRLPVAEAAARTAEAARRGDRVIYQATLFDGNWLGYADFLVRVETPSDFGPWSYEVYDTKLARKTEAKALIQLCLYSDLLAVLQGVPPKTMHVALGGSMRTTEAHRVTEYEAYYRLVKRQFEAFVTGRESVYPPATRPEPVSHCEVCRWSVDCLRERRRVDDLSLVAGITGQQRRGLREKDVPTRTSLANLPVPLPWTLDRSSNESLLRVHHQARIQVEGEREGRMRYELLDPKRREDGTLAPGMGLLSLPEPTSGDLFFDMEGDPFALVDLDGGFDYLFGIVEPGLLNAEGQATFHAIWARDEHGAMTLAGEKRAFERTIDLFMDRLERNPNLHIYHYAPYEPAAVGRLMGRHATREDEVDRLLRGGVFVDLYRAVRQGLRASVESYSIKRLEPLYGFERTVELRDAGSSIVAFSTWLQDGGEDGGDPELLERIEGYNGDDCRSNWKLRDWLEERRAELAADLQEPLPRPEREDPAPNQEVSEEMAAVQLVEGDLVASLPEDPELWKDPERARWLLAQLLSWHRREEKSSWWRFYYLRDELTDEERMDEPEPIGGLSYVAPVATVKRSAIHRYAFPPQEHEIRPEDGVTDPATKASAGTVVAVDNDARTVDLRRALSNAAPHPTSIVVRPSFSPKAQKASLLRIGSHVVEHGVEARDRYRAARELLLRRPPDFGQDPGEPLARGRLAADAARELVLRLKGGCLAIQGPPGSGKSTVGAEMIVNLVLAGKRVGVAANSHKVIGNLLTKVAESAHERHATVRIGQKPKAKEPCTYPDATAYADNDGACSALRTGGIDVIGGTTFLWADESLAESVDVLFIDEAGQMSLANALAASQAATSLVLLGDPQQLDQPLKGSHPPGAERSALAHLLEGKSTMPPELGLFLESTWRLHPDLCAYTSEAFYDGLLEPEYICRSRNIFGSGFLSGTGLRFLPIEHQGNGKSSEEEAAAVARIVGEVLASGTTWIDEKARTKTLALENVLIITPYNAQVRAITAALPGCHVGTVDKFQGQEAPIAIYSMASSSAADAPRGMEFLYSLHRLNVATSRAQCLAVVVASPELLRAQCRTPKQMRLANALCRFVERSG